MIPFHKLYLRVFSSLDFDVEKKLLLELQENGVQQFLSIKRSWIYALKISVLAVLAAMFLFINAWIGFEYFSSLFASKILPFSYLLLGFLLLFDTFWYLFSYKKNHQSNEIGYDFDSMIKKNEKVNKNFIQFFDFSVLISCVLIFLLLETIIFSIFFYSGDNVFFIILELVINAIAGLLIFKHRRLSMNLELDFGLAVPGKVYIIDQTGLLSSKQSIVAQNIKTVEGAYHSIFSSIFGYGDVKFFLEGNIPQEKGIVTLDYILNPRKTVDLINKILSL